MKEIWKDVIGYEGLYQVSNLGKMRSLDRYINNNSRIQFIKGQNIKTSKGTRGYVMVHISKNSRKKYASVHRLVAKAFIPNQENKPYINHINGVKTDCMADNLEWCTLKENQQHAIRTGLRKTKKVNQYDKDNRLIKTWDSIKNAREYIKGDIRKCCNEKAQTAGGYKWKYLI